MLERKLLEVYKKIKEGREPFIDYNKFYEYIEELDKYKIEETDIMVAPNYVQILDYRMYYNIELQEFNLVRNYKEIREHIINRINKEISIDKIEKVIDIIKKEFNSNNIEIVIEDNRNVLEYYRLKITIDNKDIYIDVTLKKEEYYNLINKHVNMLFNNICNDPHNIKYGIVQEDVSELDSLTGMKKDNESFLEIENYRILYDIEEEDYVLEFLIEKKFRNYSIG